MALSLTFQLAPSTLQRTPLSALTSPKQLPAKVYDADRLPTALAAGFILLASVSKGKPMPRSARRAGSRFSDMGGISMHDMSARGLGDINKDEAPLIRAKTVKKKFSYEPVKQKTTKNPELEFRDYKLKTTNWKGASPETRKVNMRVSNTDKKEVISAQEFEAQSMMSNHQMMTGMRDDEIQVELPIKKDDGEPVDKEILEMLIDTSDVERADMIEELTRKAFVLMEAGEIKEAQQCLKKAGKIATTWEKLQEELTGLRRVLSERPNPEKEESEILVKLKRELHQDDFSSIFGAKAKFTSFIGQW